MLPIRRFQGGFVVEGIINVWSRGRLGKAFVILAGLLFLAGLAGMVGIVVQAQSSNAQPTAVVTPVPTLAPTDPPTDTPEPTLAPAPSTASLPAAPSTPTVNPAADPKSDAYPCLGGQVKGNRKTGIYYMAGQRGYKPRNDVRCFDDEQLAQAAGYQRARE